MLIPSITWTRWTRRTRWTGLVAAILACTLPFAGRAAAQKPVSTPIAGSALFKNTGATRTKVQRMLGTPPLRCTSSGPERSLCTWRVEPGEQAHALLAAGRGLKRPIHVVCVFRAPRQTGPSRCTSHRAIPLRAIAGAGDGDGDGDGELDPSQDRLARRALHTARTLEALSRLLGAGPNDCRQRNERDWVCYWRADPNDPGYATLGVLVDAAGPARLICLLPMDGSARGEDSCRITREPDRQSS